jgi:hypothetical protein
MPVRRVEMHSEYSGFEPGDYLDLPEGKFTIMRNIRCIYGDISCHICGLRFQIGARFNSIWRETTTAGGGYRYRCLCDTCLNALIL